MSQSLPLSTTGATQAEHVFTPGMKLPKGPMALLKAQADGKMPGPVPARVLRQQLAQLQKQPHVHFNIRHSSGAVPLWTSLTPYNMVLGVNKRAKKVIAGINTLTNDCDEPIGLKVDSSQNLWVGCEDNTLTGYGAVQEYSNSGSLEGTYNVACPSGDTCSYTYGYGFDTAQNASNTFFSLAFYEFCIGSPSCSYVYGGGFEYWPVGDTSAAPVLVAASPYGEPVYDVYYMDLDSSGNIWFTYYGCESSCGYGLGEVTNPTTSPSFVDIEPPPFLQFAGGVYASNGGNTINVIDQDTHTVYQFNTSGGEIGTLGPTAFGLGDPVSGGYNSGDTKFAIGDADDWLDMGTVATNKWGVAKATLFISSLEGAAYSPSDK